MVNPKHKWKVLILLIITSYQEPHTVYSYDDSNPPPIIANISNAQYVNVAPHTLGNQLPQSTDTLAEFNHNHPIPFRPCLNYSKTSQRHHKILEVDTILPYLL